MSEIKTLNHGEKFAHASVGTLHGFEGKQFVKDATGATSCEISFGTLPSGAEVPFFHTHKENEENYIILSGAGKFQVDGNVFDIAEGSVIRVATNCDRNLKCTSAEPMTYICIQAKEGSLGAYTMTDAVISKGTASLLS
ncbi:MAG: cupin domain-containing protein [Bacteroides sp.]|nr:cupin domain-containing protein [Bacteroides sp.]MCM1390292.1 cupin domain-containing protein [Bacteroides sp.]